MRRFGFVALLLVPRVGMAGASALWLNAPLSVGQAGFGNVSLGGGDILRAWSNPAALGDLDAQGAVAANGGSLLGGNQTSIGFGGAWRLSERWTAGVLAMSTSDSFSETDASGNQVGGSVGHRVSSAGLAAGWQSGALRTGVLLRGVSDELVGDSASAVAADLGLAYALDPVIVSVAARNFGTPLRGSAGAGVDAESLPSEVRGGMAFKAVRSHLLVAVEGSQQIGGRADLGAGVEWWPVTAFGVRAGLPAMASGSSEVTAGLSVSVAKLRVDYATATHALGMTHRMSLGWSFGTAPEQVNAAPEPVVAKVPEPRPAPVEVAAPPAAGLNVAVADLQPQGVSASDAAVIADLLRSQLVVEGLRVIEKSNMDKVLAEQTFQQTGCTTQECAVKLGKLLNVQRMVVGSFGKLMDKYFLSLRLVNVESGAVIFASSANGTRVEEIEAGVKELALKIANQAR